MYGRGVRFFTGRANARADMPKVLELVQSQAKFKDEPYAPEKSDTEAISMAAGGGTGGEIPVSTEKQEEAETE